MELAVFAGEGDETLLADFRFGGFEEFGESVDGIGAAQRRKRAEAGIADFRWA